MNQARAILWAQWRTLRNFYPRGGAAWTAVIGAGWYGFWTLAAVSTARLAANPANLGMLKAVLAGGLLLVFLYWQVMPLLMAATGASLELRKLQVYPIPVSQLFTIEVMLRFTAAVEMLLLLIGLAFGLLFNPELPKWTALVPRALHFFQFVARRRLARSGRAHPGAQADSRSRVSSFGSVRGPSPVAGDARPGRRRKASAPSSAILGPAGPGPPPRT